MRIPFSNISSTGSKYTLSNMPLPTEGEEFELQGPLEMACVLYKKSENRIVLQGSLQATLLLCCDRCLSAYPFRVQADIQLIFEFQAREHWHLKELDVPAGDLDLVDLAEPVVDLEEVARQQLYMALPFKKTCSQQCKGICPECGESLNDGSCTCKGQEKASPFAVLAALKKKE